MKWFQLHTNSLYDPKIVRLIKSHGAAGFGVYCAINILIAEKERDDFSLEHEVEDLEALLNEQPILPIILTCVKLGLLIKDEKGTIKNPKISKYLGNWERRTKKLQRPYVDTTEGLQRHSVQKEEKEGREEKERKERTEVKDSSKVPMPLQLLWKEEKDLRAAIQNPKYGTDQLQGLKANLKLCLMKQRQFDNKEFTQLKDLLD